MSRGSTGFGAHFITNPWMTADVTSLKLQGTWNGWIDELQVSSKLLGSYW